MSAEIDSAPPEPLPARDDELEALADDLRDLADRIDPNDWTTDRRGYPL